MDLWCHHVINKTSSNRYYLEGQTAYEAVMGHAPDISSIVTFNFYDPLWYYEQTSNFPEPRQKIGIWLGESHNIGQAICYWVLPISGIPIAWSIVQEIPQEQLSQESIQSELKQLDEAILSKHGSHQNESPDYELDNDIDDHNTPLFEPWEPESSMPDVDEWDTEAYDQYIAAQVILPTEDAQLLGTVTGSKRDSHGNPVGQ
jgi:hypothetical protein